jgi:DNA-directed RNA polymerase subunit L
MEIEIINSEKSYLEFHLVGESYTFCNVLRSVLSEDAAVKGVAYTVEHPITHRFRPRFEVQTDGKSRPSTVLGRASKRLAKRCDELSDEFNKALG